MSLCPLDYVRERLGDDAWWSVTEGRLGTTWSVGREGCDPQSVVLLGVGATLEEAVEKATKR